MRGVAQVGSDWQSERLTMVLLMTNLVLIINLINPSILLALEHCSRNMLGPCEVVRDVLSQVPLILGKVKLYFIQHMTKSHRSLATLFDSLTIYSALTMRSLEITSAQFILRNWN